MPPTTPSGTWDDTGPRLNRREMVPWLATGALLLAGCQPVPGSPLKLGMNPWVGYDPLVLARERGLLDRTRVKVIELSSGSEAQRHLRNGLLDGAALTLDEALRLADDGVEIRIVNLLSRSAGADLVLARPEIARPDQLRGHAIAVEKTTVGALMLQRLLGEAGLQPHHVRVLNMEASQHLGAIRNGRVDAVVTFEPLAGALRAEGLRPIFDSRKMPGDIVDVLVVHERMLSQHRDKVEALVTGWRRGLQALLRDPAQGAQALAAGVDLTPAEYLTVLQGLRFYDDEEARSLLGGRPRALGQQSQGLALTLQMMGLIRETPDWGRLLDEDWAAHMAVLGGGEP